MSKTTVNQLAKVFQIFASSKGTIKPHCIITGASGSGKSYTVERLAEGFKLPVVQINAAGLTKEGISGNSLSKALTPLLQLGSQPAVCFVDEFDKLFISGNTNSELAHESTNGVQNEFLRVLEGFATVFGDYGKFHSVSTDNILFVFAGAFNGEEDLDIDRLKELGVKTEFVGRVGLVFSLTRTPLNELLQILQDSPLLKQYLGLFKKVEMKQAYADISCAVEEQYENNTLGVRLVTTLIHQYFIHGTLEKPKKEVVQTFDQTLELDK